MGSYYDLSMVAYIIDLDTQNKSLESQNLEADSFSICNNCLQVRVVWELQ